MIESRGLAFVLTGSSARSLRRKGVNLLAGRALTHYLHPLTVSEQRSAFSLEDSLRFGHLPARFSEANAEKYLRDYVQTYLREEVIQEGLTRNIGHFARFLEVASFSQGAVLNLSNIARCFLFYGGGIPIHQEGVSVLPVDFALRNLDSILRNED